MITVICDWCGKELNEPGAIIIPPPPNDRKKHMCIKEWNLVKEALGDPDS